MGYFTITLTACDYMQTASLIRLPCRPFHLLEDVIGELWREIKAARVHLLPATLGLLPLASAWPRLSLDMAVPALVLWLLMGLIMLKPKMEILGSAMAAGLMWLLWPKGVMADIQTGIAWSMLGYLLCLSVAWRCPWPWPQRLARSLAICWIMHALAMILEQPLAGNQLMLAAAVIFHAEHRNSTAVASYADFALAVGTLAVLAMASVDMPLSTLLIPAGLMIFLKAVLELANKDYPIPAAQHMIAIFVFIMAASLGSGSQPPILIYPLT